MKVFKKKGELTKFQILAEIAKGQPHLRQKDIADELGITVQAVSENLKTLVDEGWVETGSGQSRYKITKRGIEKVKKGAVDLRKYSDQVLDTMNTYKSVWPAIALEDLSTGETVWLKMENGTLYAGKEESSAHAEVLHHTKKGEDVALINLNGIIELESGFVVIIKLPTINQGGSRACDLDQISEIIKKYPEQFHRVGIMGTVSRAIVDKLGINADFEFATPQATIAASKRGLNILVFAVGKMSRSLTKKMDDEGISYVIEDLVDSKR
ncbi:MAG: winged helix-turn-helix transcriptional regulator [Methanobacterium sp.]|jgi:putative transcriptional regulator|nr:winged helix-turn-helix transcriptional regulator [Methanobacterium sp.]